MTSGSQRRPRRQQMTVFSHPFPPSGPEPGANERRALSNMKWKQLQRGWQLATQTCAAAKHARLRSIKSHFLSSSALFFAAERERKEPNAANTRTRGHRAHSMLFVIEIVTQWLDLFVWPCLRCVCVAFGEARTKRGD